MHSRNTQCIMHYEMPQDSKYLYRTLDSINFNGIVELVLLLLQRSFYSSLMLTSSSIILTALVADSISLTNTV